MPLDCENIVRSHLNRGMTDREVQDFADQGKKLLRQAVAAAKAAGRYPDIQKLTEDWTKAHQLSLVRQKYAAEKNAAARMRIFNFVFNEFSGMEGEGISAVMVGSKYMRRGARMSVDSVRTSLMGSYVGGLVTEIEALNPGFREILSKGKMDRQISEALWSIDNPNATYNGPAEAMQIAGIIHKYQERARLDENMAGAYIMKMKGYITRQTHDPARLRKAGFDQWRADIEPKLDWENTLNGELLNAAPEERTRFLWEAYTGLVTGIHEHYAPTFARAKGDPLTSSGHVGSLASKVSQHRVLHFLSGGDWHDYNLKYGHSNLLSTVITGLRRSANDTALMRFFGPSPQTTLENVMNDVRQVFRNKGDNDALDKFNKMTVRLKNQMKELDGSLNIEGNPTLASVGRVTRAIQSMARLGAAVVSALSDTALIAQEMSYQGRGYFQSFSDVISKAVKGYGTTEQRNILSSMGVFVDSMAGDLISKYSGQELPGRTAKMMDVFFRWSGLGPWTDSFKKSVALTMAHDLALERHNAWNALTPARRRVLTLYDIDEDLWNMLRKQAMRADDGREYFTPEAAMDIDVNEIKAYLAKQGRNVNDPLAEQFKEEVASRLRAYYRDRVQYAVLEPDARTQSILHQGLQAGTVTGELIRWAMQFKSFPVVFLQRSFQREIYGRGDDSFWRGLGHAFVRNSQGERTGLMTMLAATTLLGYVAMTVKQGLRQLSPRNPTESPEAFGKVLLASLVQGGGAGIYGDFLFGVRSRMGGGFLDTLAGPTMGSAADLVDIYQRIRDGEDAQTQSFRFLWSHLPGNNIFYLRTAFDQLFLHSMYEWLNPGYIERYKKRIKRDNNQTFFWQPNVWDWARNSPFKKSGYAGPVRKRE